MSLYDRVLYSGYEFVIVEICDFADSMVVIRNNSGSACVDVNDLILIGGAA